MADNYEGSLRSALEMALQDVPLPEDEKERLIVAAERKAHVEGALRAGIPMSVIEGRARLSDHFSREYIQCSSS
jgi:hypothetical protein